MYMQIHFLFVYPHDPSLLQIVSEAMYSEGATT